MVRSGGSDHNGGLQPSWCSSWMLRRGVTAATSQESSRKRHLFMNVKEKIIMYNIFWIIGVIVVVLAILSFIGLR